MCADVPELEEGLLQEVPVRAAAHRVPPGPLPARPLQRRDCHQDD